MPLGCKGTRTPGAVYNSQGTVDLAKEVICDGANMNVVASTLGEQDV